jgi:predicted RNase H-like HicB family nuclease
MIVLEYLALLTEVSSIDIEYQIKSIDEAIESMQIAKEVYLKDLEIILKLEKQINEKSNRKK